MSQENRVNVDVKLGVNKFHVDEGHPHIILAANPDSKEFQKLLNACPAGLYKQDEAAAIFFLADLLFRSCCGCLRRSRLPS